MSILTVRSSAFDRDCAILCSLFALWQNLYNMVKLSQKRNCPLQKDLFIKFRIVFSIQFKAGCDAFHLRIVQYIDNINSISITKCMYDA